MTDTPTPSIEEVKERLLEAEAKHARANQEGTSIGARIYPTPALLKVAHATIAALQSKLAEMQEALQPFAEAADIFEREYPHVMKPETGCNIRFDALCAARATLKDRPNTAKDAGDAEVS